jgi:hypothetical protein
MLPACPFRPGLSGAAAACYHPPLPALTKTAIFFWKQGHSLGTAHTVTVNSLIESNKQTNKHAANFAGFEPRIEWSCNHGI